MTTPLPPAKARAKMLTVVRESKERVSWAIDRLARRAADYDTHDGRTVDWREALEINRTRAPGEWARKKELSHDDWLDIAGHLERAARDLQTAANYAENRARLIRSAQLAAAQEARQAAADAEAAES